MTIPRDETVAMAKLEEIAVAIPPSRAQDHAIAYRPDWRTGRRRVVGAPVLLPDSEDGMESPAKGAGDAPELEWRAKERRAQRLSVAVEEIAAHRTARVTNRLQLRSRERERCRENL